MSTRTEDTDKRVITNIYKRLSIQRMLQMKLCNTICFSDLIVSCCYGSRNLGLPLWSRP